MVEGTGIAPEFAANVATLWTSSDVDYDSQDDESDNGSDFDNSKDKLGFTVSFDAIKS
jgi:hypothetical protein